MSFYLFSAKYTAAAIKAMVDNPQDREAPARKLVEGLGCTLHNMFFCMGEDDIIALIEAPDDETMAAGSMAVAASGAFSGGSTTKLMTPADAVSAMEKANTALGSYVPPTG